MSNEIQFAYGTTGVTIKALVLNASGQRWNGTAFVDTSAVADAAWSTGLVTVSEKKTSDNTATGLYYGDMPGGAASAAVSALFFSGTPTPSSTPIGAQAFAVGVKLTSDGLDAINTTPPTSGPATGWTFRQMLVMLARLFQAKATEDAANRKLYADDGATVITTLPISDDGTTQTQGPAT